MKTSSSLCVLILLASVWQAPGFAQDSGSLSGDAIFDAPNPYADNLEFQGVNPEFSIGNDDSENAPVPEEDFANPYAAPDFDPNAEAQFDPNADANLSAEESYANSVDRTRAVREARRKEEIEKLRNDPEKDDEALFFGRGALAKRAVLQHGCSSGGTIEHCMQRKALLLNLTDKGWVVRGAGEGRFVVERVLLMGGTLPLTYGWLVDAEGAVEATTIRAEMITELPL